MNLDSIHALRALNFEVSSENDAVLHFDLPSYFPGKVKAQPLTLILDNEVDGVFVQPNAVFVSVTDTVHSDTIIPRYLESVDLGHFMKLSLHFPYRNILNETIEILFHVALWFAMFVLLIVGLYHAIKYLMTGDFDHDIQSASFNRIAIMYGVFGIITGSIWAKIHGILSGLPMLAQYDSCSHADLSGVSLYLEVLLQIMTGEQKCQLPKRYFCIFSTYTF
ncbi:MAG: hypothetical protein IPP49_12105 [Saprospiraceae bacterium]|nr:hypothetical protein [Saprospiraceae bacterium]